MKIGFFDSGIGGLTVLERAQKLLPKAEYIYYADTDHVPYGTKPKEEILGYVDEAVKYLTDQGADVIVIACNTATSVAIQYIREKYSIPILGMEPAVKSAVTKSAHKRVMIIATPLTLREEKLKNLLQEVDGEHRTDLLPLPKLVSFAETGLFDTPEVENYLRESFETYTMEQYSTLVLGCTHFNYFKDILRKILPDQVKFVDGIDGTVHHLVNILKENGSVKEGNSSLQIAQSGRLVTAKEDLEYYQGLLKRAYEMSAL